MTVGVVIVDDDALVRSGLAFMLRAAEGIEVLGEASDGDEVARSRRKAPAGCRAHGSTDGPRRRNRGHTSTPGRCPRRRR